MKTPYTTIEKAKEAVSNGAVVNWQNSSYTLKVNKAGDFNIVCANGFCSPLEAGYNAEDFYTTRPLITKGEFIRILPKWQDPGDADRTWYAVEDEIPTGYLRIAAINGMGHMTAQSHMIERLPAPTQDEIIASMARLAFIVETVAHLQGRERDLLPDADKARAIIARMKGRAE